MAYINKHLTFFNTYTDYVAATKHTPNVSYVHDKLRVLYWMNIETIWGVLINSDKT